MKIKNENIEMILEYKYLWTTIDNKFTWHDDHTSIVASAQSMFYLRILSYLYVDNPIFYKCIVVSILLFNYVVWFWACRKDDFKKMESVVKRPSINNRK